MVAFDASFLILALDQDAVAKNSTPRLQERIDLFIAELSRSRTKILIPTPALSEFLTRADLSILEEIHATARFVIAPFDERAAIEAAEMTKNALREGDKKDPVLAATWSKVKFDRQIVAIAKIEDADAIYSTDPEVERHAKKAGLRCCGIADLPLPPSTQEMLPGIQSPGE